MEETNGQLFDDVLAEDGGHFGHKMISFLNDDILGPQDVSRRLFFVYKTYYEKLVHEELVAPENGKTCEIGGWSIIWIHTKVYAFRFEAEHQERTREFREIDIDLEIYCRLVIVDIVNRLGEM